MRLGRRMKERPIVLVSEAPFQVEEAYNSLRTNIQFLSADKKMKKLIITSSRPIEGKTTVSVNLAISMAKAGQKVLLVDADLRKPRVNKLFRVKASPGLTNILIEGIALEKAIIRDSNHDVDVVTSGPVPPNPSELLGSVRMKELLESVTDKYDYIILDTPPAAFMTDAAVLSQYVDGVILVVAHKRSTYEMVDGTVSSLKTAGANIVGTVLTDVEMNKMGHRYNYYYKYRYHKYYENN